MPLKRKTMTHKACVVCGKVKKVEDLSNHSQCYKCAKKRMLKAFDILWKFRRE